MLCEIESLTGILIHDEYKPIISPLVYELVIWKNWKKAFSETKSLSLKQSHNG